LNVGRTILRVLFLLVIILYVVHTPRIVSATEDSKDNITYIAIGDSLTEGLLDSRILSDSGGYYEYLVEALHFKGYEVDSANFAKSGATSTEINAQLKNVKDYPSSVDILTVSVGLNDLKPHLYPISDKTFKEDVAKAHAVLNLFQDNIDDTKEFVDESKNTFISIEEELPLLNKAIDQTIEELETNTDVASSENIDDIITTLKDLSADIEEQQENINDTTKQLTFKSKDIDDEKIDTLQDDIKSSYKKIKKWNRYASSILKDISKQEVPDELEEVQDSLGEVEEHLGTLIFMITSGQSQLKDSYQALHIMSETYEKVPAAQSVIDDGVDLIDKAFSNAHGELMSIEQNIHTIIDNAQEINPEVDIYILGYYNTKPYMSQGLQERMVELITDLNDTIESTTLEDKVTFVPSYDAFDKRYEELLPNQNDIHPNQAGYQVIAEQFIVALNDNYPYVSDVMNQPDDVSSLIRQAEKNVALNITNKDTLTKREKWLRTIRNTNVLIPLSAITIVGLLVLWRWKRKNYPLNN